MKNAICIKNLTKRRASFALQGINLTLPRGYIMGLIGPNGAGKTTLLKLILNLLKKDSGTIEVLGMDAQREEQTIKSRIGFVHESQVFYDFLSLSRIRAIIAPFYPTWDESRFTFLTKAFELPLSQKYGSLSHGMKTKFTLALAMSHQAELLILDEPTTGLDPVFRRGLLEQLAELLQDEKKSILFSTHITTDLERIADFITLIQNGQIVFSGKKDDMMENWGIARGGLELLTPESESHFLGWRRHAYGFEALTRNVSAARETFGASIMIERPSLDDLVYFTAQPDQVPASSRDHITRLN